MSPKTPSKPRQKFTVPIELVSVVEYDQQHGCRVTFASPAPDVDSGTKPSAFTPHTYKYSVCNPPLAHPIYSTDDLNDACRIVEHFPGAYIEENF
jgi:hypothetical protein